MKAILITIVIILLLFFSGRRYCTKPIAIAPLKAKPADTTDTAKPVKRLIHKQAVNARHRPATIPHSPVRSLSDEKYNALVKGEGFEDMSLVGELNHYPLPDKALKYKVQLGLNPGQITKLKELAPQTFSVRKKEMGENIIRNERMLDTLFRKKQIDDGTIIFYTNRYGLYVGEVINAVLQACLNTEAILSDTQIRKLESLVKVS